MAVFEIERWVPVPQAVAWDVVTDHEAFGRIAPNLSRVHVVAGSGTGMTRRCYDTRGRGWSESCTLWDEGRQYRMEVDTSDYPYPLRKMQGTFGVAEGDNGTTLRMRFDYEMKYGLLGRLLERTLLPRTFRQVCTEILDRWEEMAVERAGPAHPAVERAPAPH